MVRTATWIVLFVLPFALPVNVSAQSASDVLVTADIGSYKASKRPFCGSGSGILAGADHFELDHTDTACGISYFDVSTRLGVKVEVTLHTSTQWLGHEVEDGYRDGDDSDGRLGLLSGESVKIRDLDGHKIFYWGLGGGSYTWMSGTSTVVEIKYTDLQRTKPEPLEIVRAYLAKYPSSITMTDAELKSASHTESWLRNEMERRVWLMEKWAGVGSADVLKQAEAERAILEHAEVFSKYMHKYLGDSPNEMIKGFFLASRPFNWTRLTAEVGKLRAWWDANKSRPLLISGVSPGFRLAEGWPILLGGLGAARQLWVERGRVSGYLGRWLSKSR
jgi:hypothetical protein